MNNPSLNTLQIQSPGEDDDVFNQVAIMHSLWDRKWAILGLSVVVSVLVGLWVGSQPPSMKPRPRCW